MNNHEVVSVGDAAVFVAWPNRESHEMTERQQLTCQTCISQVILEWKRMHLADTIYILLFLVYVLCFWIQNMQSSVLLVSWRILNMLHLLQVRQKLDVGKSLYKRWSKLMQITYAHASMSKIAESALCQPLCPLVSLWTALIDICINEHQLSIYWPCPVTIYMTAG